MTEPGANLERRPSKRAKNVTGLQAIGSDLQAEALLKYSLKLPQSFTPGAIQANRVALRVVEGRCLAYVANAQHVYEVSLGSELAATCLPAWKGVDQGKEGVLIPQSAQVAHVRQLEPLSYMAAEVQELYAGVHGGHRILAAVDAVGNTRLLAEPLTRGPRGPPGEQEEAGDGVSSRRGLLTLNAPSRGECGWTGLAVRSPGEVAAGAGGAGGGDTQQDGGSPSCGPLLEVAVARQRLRDVVVYRDGARLRTLHTIQCPTALTYLGAGSPGSGCGETVSGLLAVAEEHQVSLWDVRQGERGGCVQRLGVHGGGFPIYSLRWLPAPATASGGGDTAVATGRPRQQHHQQQKKQKHGTGGGSGEGLLAAAGGERSVVVLEPRKWHIVAKWPGCVKYPATHLSASVLAPGHVYVAGLDYECVGGRWDGSCGSSTGNANSGTGGHGRAIGPVQLLKANRAQQQQQEDGAMAAGPMAADEGPEGGISGRGGLSFRGDSKWLGLASCSVPLLAGTAGESAARREVAAALSLSGNLYVLVTSASVVASC